MAEKNYYETLGVDKNSGADEIKSAYRRLAKKYHPDINKSPDAPARFKEINEAYEVLSDPQKKQNYDQFGSAEGQGFNFNQEGFNFNQGGFDFNGGGFSDFFSDIFSAFGGGSRTRQTVMQGEDINLQLDISFEEAVFGVTKNILINKIETCSECDGSGAKNGTDFTTCTECNGSGRVRYTQNTMFGTTIREAVCKECSGTGKKIKSKCSECAGKGYKKVSKTISVKIPAGIDNDQVIRMKGEGNAPLRKGINGDLTIKINVKPHNVLVRKGVDIYLDLYIPFTTSLLGGKVEIPTVNGPYMLEIKELTQSGTVMRLKNKGIKQLNREYYGDMLVTVKSEVPKTLDKKAKDKIKELSTLFTEDDYDKYKKYLKNVK